MKRIIPGVFSLLLALVWPLASLAGTSAPLVVVDQGHGQRFRIEDQGELQLTRFAGLLRGHGLEVRAVSAALDDATLGAASGLVISGPFQPLSPEEVEAVVRFVRRGGRLAVMLHIGTPLADLLHRLDVDISNAVLHERRHIIDSDLNFLVTGLPVSPLFTGISGFSVYGAWALNSAAPGTVRAGTSNEAWIDLNGDGSLSKGDAVGSFSVLISHMLDSGGFVIFGDDALFQNRYLEGENSRLAANLGAWLAGK